MQVELTWTDEDQIWGESTLRNWQTQLVYPVDPPPKWTWGETQLQGKALLRLQLAAEELLLLARARGSFGTGEGLLAWLQNPQNVVEQLASQRTKVGAGQEEADAIDRDGLGNLYALARGSLLQCYRSVRRIDGTIMKAEPPQLGAWQLPLIIVGGAALVASAWVISKEWAPAWQAVNSERAWSAARAFSEIEVNRLAIAAGQKPVLSDWARIRAAGARRDTSKWMMLSAGIGAGAVGIVGGYYAIRRIGGGSRPSQAPRRRNPSRGPSSSRRRRPSSRSSRSSRSSKRPRRRRNQQMALQFDYPERRAMREAAPKRKPTRKTSTTPRKSKQTSTRKPRGQRVTKKAIRDALETVNRVTVPWQWRTVERRYSVVYNKPEPPMALTNDPQQWEEITASDDFEHAILVMEDQAFAGYPSAVVDNNAPTYEHRKSIRRVAVPTKKNPRKNPGDAHRIHELGTAAANVAVDDAISRQLKRWPTKPKPAQVDALAAELGRWPAPDEWKLYQQAWAEQVTTRKLKHKEAADPKRTATTVRSNPLIRGYSESTIRKNIAAEVRAGTDPKQASAIAYRIAREAWRARHPRGAYPAHLRPPTARKRKRSSSSTARSSRSSRSSKATAKRDKRGRFVKARRPKARSRVGRRGDGTRSRARRRGGGGRS